MKYIKEQKKNDYKVIISELGANPLRTIKATFLLMGIVPILVLFYLIIGKNFLYTLFLGSNGLIVSVAIFISIMGFLLAYNLVVSMVIKLLAYSAERKQSDEEKSELLLAVSHDLKTPLTVIKTGIQNMLDGVAGSINETQAKIAQVCMQAVDKTTNFIHELIDISRIKFIRLNFKRELIDFEKIATAEINGIAELAKKNNQDLRYRPLSKETNLWGDREKLSRAVMNLLSNAVKYTPQGGRIDIELSTDEDTVKFRVINTGPGIPADKLDRLFNKYEKLNQDPKIEGSGLGLSIVKDIINLHKGHLAVKSEPDKETEFSIALPKDLRAKGQR